MQPLETVADYLRYAEEFAAQAQISRRREDQDNWLRLAADWLLLAETIQVQHEGEHTLPLMHMSRQARAGRRALNLPPPDPLIAVMGAFTTEMNAFTQELVEEIRTTRRIARKLRPFSLVGGNVMPFRKRNAA